VPKALIPVAGRPFIEHQFELLAPQGLRDVVLCIGHKGDMIVDHVGDGSRWEMNVSYAQEDPDNLLGTGGALVNALDQLQDAFFVLYGDSYLPCDYRMIVQTFQAQDVPGMMTVFHNKGQWDASNVRIADQRVVYYDKDADPTTVEYIDYGLTALRREVVEAYRESEMPLDMARIQGDLVTRGVMGACEVFERFYEIGKPEGLAELEELLAAKDGQADINREEG
jgi:NDP-sugar pyrophosphorylase family protein